MWGSLFDTRRAWSARQQNESGRMAMHTSATREGMPEGELDLLKKLRELRDARILTEERIPEKEAQILGL